MSIACINALVSRAVLKVPERVTAAENALHANPVDIEAIREATRGRGGLVGRNLRKEAWPKLLGINTFRVNEYTGVFLAVEGVVTAPCVYTPLYMW